MSSLLNNLSYPLRQYVLSPSCCILPTLLFCRRRNMKVAFTFIGFQSNIGNQVLVFEGLLHIPHSLQNVLSCPFVRSCRRRDVVSQRVHSNTSDVLYLRGDALTFGSNVDYGTRVVENRSVLAFKSHERDAHNNDTFSFSYHSNLLESSHQSNLQHEIA